MEPLLTFNTGYFYSLVIESRHFIADTAECGFVSQLLANGAEVKITGPFVSIFFTTIDALNTIFTFKVNFSESLYLQLNVFICSTSDSLG